jgi:hypothetical protein
VEPPSADKAVDRSPYKHGRFLPGMHIPIYLPEPIRERRPDNILTLPWNVRDVVTQVAYAREWEAKFIVPVPAARVLDRGCSIRNE